MLIVKAVIDGGRTLPNNIFEIKEYGTFKEILKIIAKGINPYTYDLTKNYCTQGFLEGLRKSIERNTEDIDLNSFHTLKELKDRLDGKKQNEIKENSGKEIIII